MRWVVGLLLVAAAFLKTLELFFYPASSFANNFFFAKDWNFLLPLQISSEFGLGLLALRGVYWRQLRTLILLLFAGFTCYSLFLALQGAASCGCFGMVQVNPWWTFGLDVAICLGLAVDLTKASAKGSPDEGPADDSGPAESGPARDTTTSAQRGLAGILAMTLTLAVGLTWYVHSQQSEPSPGLQQLGGITLLEPETWVGQRFPLIEHLSVDVSEGEWILLLHRHDCPKCQEALPKYKRLARLKPGRKVAVIEVPPYGEHSTEEPPLPYVGGQLADDREWFVQTPVEIQLKDGQVTLASDSLPALNLNSTEIRERDLEGMSTSHAAGSPIQSTSVQ